MRSDLWLWSLPVLALAGVLFAFWACDQVIHSFTSRDSEDEDDEEDVDAGPAKARRRAVTGAAFALQEIFDPGIAHVVRAQQDAHVEEADPAGGDDDEIRSPESFHEEIVAALAREPIDVEEVRRILTESQRADHDWREVYERAVTAVRGERPYLAPGLPPSGRVAPR